MNNEEKFYREVYLPYCNTKLSGINTGETWSMAKYLKEHFDKKREAEIEDLKIVLREAMDSVSSLYMREKARKVLGEV